MESSNDIETEFNWFKDVAISKDGCEYIKSSFDRINTVLLSDSLFEDNQNDDIAIVVPKDPTVTPIVVIESLLALLNYEITRNSIDLLENLSYGDSVALIDSKRNIIPAFFCGQEDREGRKFYKVKEGPPSNMTTWVPESRKYRIQPYHSLDTNKKKSKSVVYGEELEKVIGLAPGGLMAYQRLKGILVTANKSRFRDEIKEFSIGGESIDKIFPIADFTDSDEYKPLFNDRMRRDFVLSVVSHTDIAADIAQKDESYKFIIVEGASKIKNSIGSINLLNSDKHPRKIICLLNTQDEEEMDNLKSLGFNFFIWKYGDFDNVVLEDTSSAEISSHNNVLSSLGSSKRSTEVLDAANIDSMLRKLVSIVNKLAASIPDNDSSNYMIKRLLGVYYFFLHIPVNIIDYERARFLSGEKLYIDLLGELMEEVSMSMGVIFPRDTKALCTELTETITNLYNLLEKQNPRYSKLVDNIKYEKEVTVVCSQDDFKKCLINKLESESALIKVISKNELTLNPQKKIYYCGYFSRKNVAKTFLAPYEEVIFQLYKNELCSYESILKNHPASPYSTLDKPFREKYGMHIENSTTVKKADDISGVEFLFENNNFNLSRGHEWDSFELSKNDSERTVVAQRFMLESGRVVYADESFKFNRLDRENNDIQKISATDIQIDDEVIFAANTRDLFEDFLAELKTTRSYIELDEKASIWWKALVKYKEDNHLSVEELASHLDLVRCARGTMTINNWISGETIAPKDAEQSINAIAKLTKDKYLIDNISVIVYSTKALHALHVRAGRALVRGIINSVVESNDDINDEIKSAIHRHLEAVVLDVVEDIDSAKYDVPISFIGQLFDMMERR